MTSFLCLLAQATQPAAGAAPPTPMSNPMNMLIAMGAVMIFFLWWTSRSQKREQKRFQDMLANLKKNDRIQTIGGILGTVVDARDNEVVIKIDEANNVRIRVVRGAIKEVLQEAPSPDSKDDKPGKK